METVPPMVGPDWGGYSYHYGDGLLARIHFDVRAAEESPHTGHPNGIRVILFIPQGRVGRDGQPASAAEMESLLARQRRLVEQLTAAAVRCRFVGSMLYGGMFDLVFQADPRDTERLKALVAGWSKTVAPYRVEVRESAGWEFFDSRVRPSPEHAQQIADRRVIESLIEAGSDPTQPHQLDHRIVGPADVLRRIARDLEANGFTRARFPGDSVLLINTVAPLHLFEIWNTTGRLVGYCAKCGARYDGWGAAVVPARG
jgi:regulator of RNase E activity RraB